MLTVRPRPDSELEVDGEGGSVSDCHDVPRRRVGGRSVHGSNVIASHRYLAREVREKVLGNTVIVVNDKLDISTCLRSGSVPVRAVHLDDLHTP